MWYKECVNLGEYKIKVKKQSVWDLEAADFYVWYLKSPKWQMSGFGRNFDKVRYSESLLCYGEEIYKS